MEMSGNNCHGPAEYYYSLFGSSPSLPLLRGATDEQPFSFFTGNDIPPLGNTSTPHSMCMRATNMSDHCERSVAVDEAPEQSKVIVSIPLDVMLEILSKLPAKSILRFRCVCKLWNSVMQEHYFITHHLNNTPNDNDLGIVALCQLPSLTNFSSFPSIHHFSNGFHRFNMTGLENDGIYSHKLSNSCNGLVCVYRDHIICVVNPSIREVLVLPPISDTFHSWGIAIGQNTSTGEYKIVRHCWHGNRKVGCAVFKLGSDSWQIVQDAPTVVNDRIPPIVVNGAIHWLSYDVSEPKLVSFDIKNESFDVIIPPAEFIRHKNTILLEMEGNLCLSTIQGTGEYIFLLVLEDYNNRRWRTHLINTTQIRNCVQSSLAVPVLVRNGQVLWRFGRNRFCCYSMRSGRYADTPHSRYEYVGVCPYKESLISPFAIQGKNNMRIGFPDWAGATSKREH